MSSSKVSELFERELEDLAQIQSKSPVLFLVRTYCVQMLLVILMIPFAILFGWLADFTGFRSPAPEGGDPLFAHGITTAIVYGIILAPLIETLLFQVLFVELSRCFTKRSEIGLYVSGILFALAHFTNSIESGILAGVSGGLALGMVYVIGRKRSFFHAFLFTFLSHALWNAPIILAASAQIAFG